MGFLNHFAARWRPVSSQVSFGGHWVCRKTRWMLQDSQRKMNC